MIIIGKIKIYISYYNLKMCIRRLCNILLFWLYLPLLKKCIDFMRKKTSRYMNWWMFTNLKKNISGFFDKLILYITNDFMNFLHSIKNIDIYTIYLDCCVKSSVQCWRIFSNYEPEKAFLTFLTLWESFVMRMHQLDF